MNISICVAMSEIVPSDHYFSLLYIMDKELLTHNLII